MVNKNTKKVTAMGMFCALAYVFMLVGKLIPSVLGFLSYDPKDVIIVISGFILGPVPAFIITVIVSLIEMLTVSHTGFIGLAMNIISSASFAVIPAVFYQKFKKLNGAIVGLVLGVVSMTACMLLWNYLITPIYMNVPREVVAGMLLTTFLPFNFIKGCINASITLLFYKPLVNGLRKANLIEKRIDVNGNVEEDKHQTNVLLISSCVFVLTVCIVAFVILSSK